MIYIITSAIKDSVNIKDKKKNYTYKTILKIGYTNDVTPKKRFTSYEVANPSYDILYTIPDCTQDDEKKLHYYFEKYKYDYGDEWFYYEDEIIEFFDTHKTKESIDELGLVKKPKIPKRPKSESTLFKEELAKWLKDNNTTLSDIVKKVLIIFTAVRVKGLILFPDKLKFLCNTLYFNRDKRSISDKDIELILSRLPLDYSKYLTTLGPDRCRANGYNITKIRKELESTYLKDIKANLKSKILSEFEVGKRYLKSDIKEKLGVTYSSLSYTKTPKATDLENYFEVKNCKISNGSKMRDGFEILKEK